MLDLRSQNFKVGLYIRLSREDGDKQESESIGNQRKILQRYVKENDLNFVREYVDDGVSGTTFDRHSFNEMLKDIEEKNINMVITKDLSRLGRDYIKTGYYIEDFFSKNNIRYVAILDGVDTAYGYKRHPSIKNKLIVDESVRNVIERIFTMYANGLGSSEIVNYLNKNKYLSPTGYRKTGVIQDENKVGFNWNEVTLCNMLKNEVYIGNTVQNKKSIISYKVKKVRNIEKENQIRVDNTHEAIIDKDLFEKVQCIMKKRGTNTKLKHEYLFRGLLYCYHCKRKLQIVLKKNSRRNAKEHPYIVCSDYKERGCYVQSMNYDKFEEHMLKIIKKICRIYADKELFYAIYEKYQNKTLDIREGYKRKIDQINKAIFEINNKLDSMYMDKLNSVILVEDYVRFASKLGFERTKLNEQKQEVEEKLKNTERKIEFKSQTKEEKELEKLIENFLKFEKPDKIFLYRLINKIEIDKDKNIYIYFNFSKLNSINENLDEFIKIEEIFKKTG